MSSFYKAILLYSLKCRKSTKNKRLKDPRAKNARIILLSKWAVCERKKSKFTKDQEASGLLSSLEEKIPLIKIPLGINMLMQDIK